MGNADYRTYTVENAPEASLLSAIDRGCTRFEITGGVCGWVEVDKSTSGVNLRKFNCALMGCCLFVDMEHFSFMSS